MTAPAFAREITLDRFDRANLLGAIANLEDIAHDVGIQRIAVSVWGVDHASAKAVLPDGDVSDLEVYPDTQFSTVSDDEGIVRLKFFVNRESAPSDPARVVPAAPSAATEEPNRTDAPSHTEGVAAAGTTRRTEEAS